MAKDLSVSQWLGTVESYKTTSHRSNSSNLWSIFSALAVKQTRWPNAMRGNKFIHSTCRVKTLQLLYSIVHTYRNNSSERGLYRKYNCFFFFKYSLTVILTKFLRPHSLLMDTQRDSNHSRSSKFLMVLNTFWNCNAIFDNKTTCLNTTGYFVVCTK